MERPEAIWKGVLSRSTATADEKKLKIIEATILLMAREGINAVTFEAVGHRLKTTKANIKYHFQDKDQLIFTAIRMIVLNAQAITGRQVEAVNSPEEKLTAVIDGAYQWFEHFPEHVGVWFLFVYYAYVHEDYAKFYLETRLIGQQRMQLLLRALPHTDEQGLEYLELAESIQNILYGFIYGLIGKPKNIRISRRAASDTIAALLKSKGLKWSRKS